MLQFIGSQRVRHTEGLTEGTYPLCLGPMAISLSRPQFISHT